MMIMKLISQAIVQKDASMDVGAELYSDTTNCSEAVWV
jgi:hypothetical protein